MEHDLTHEGPQAQWHSPQALIVTKPPTLPGSQEVTRRKGGDGCRHAPPPCPRRKGPAGSSRPGTPWAEARPRSPAQPALWTPEDHRADAATDASPATSHHSLSNVGRAPLCPRETRGSEELLQDQRRQSLPGRHPGCPETLARACGIFFRMIFIPGTCYVLGFLPGLGPCWAHIWGDSHALHWRLMVTLGIKCDTCLSV